MDIRYEHRYDNKYIKMICVNSTKEYVTVREFLCHTDETKSTMDEADLGVTKIPTNVWECASKTIENATRLPFSEDEIFRYEDVEKIGNTWKIILKPFQVNFFMNKGIECFCKVAQIKELNFTLHTYYTIISSEDLVKILPRR